MAESVTRLIIAALLCLQFSTAGGAEPQHVAVRGATVISVNGLRFRDLNHDGVLAPYEDWRLPASRRAADLIRRMTIEEKAGLMMHAAHSGFVGPGGSVLRELAPTPPGALRPPVNVSGVPGFDRADKPSPYDLIRKLNVRWINTSPGGTPTDAVRWANAIQAIAEESRLGIPVVLSADPVHTTNRLPGGGLPPPDRRKITSSWPDQIGLAAIGDVALVREFGRIAAAEYRALGYRMILNPMADVSTEPRWNRIPGTFGEDAELSAQLVAAYIRGFQGESLGRESVLTVVKHFPGNGPVAQGFDPHNPYGQFQVYPTGRMAYHLTPFRAAIAAGVTGVMGGYAIPQGIDTVGINFSKKILTDLLRRDLGFDGIVMTDWLHAMPWGVQTLSKRDRQLRIILAGADQLGGEHDPAHIIDLATLGKISPTRLAQSTQRLLTPMFAIGLFDDPFVDVDAVTPIVGSHEFRAAGATAQRRAIVLLKNDHDLLPLKPGARIFLSGFTNPPAALTARAVSDINAADVSIVAVNAPYQLRTDGTNFFVETHEGTLAYAGATNAEDLELIRGAVRAGKPVVVVMSMERPAVLCEFIDTVSAMVATFGSDNDAVADILTGTAAPAGHLPFDLPADMSSVEAQAEDAPHDFARTLFHSGFGLSYSRVSTVPPAHTFRQEASRRICMQ